MSGDGFDASIEGTRAEGLCACLSRVEPEQRYRLGKPAALFLERLRCGGGLFDERRVLLGDFIHLCNGQIDLLDAAALLVRRGRDLAHDVGHARDRM